MSSGLILTEQESSALLNSFPCVQFAFAYGSGAIKQDSYNYNNDSSTTRNIDATKSNKKSHKVTSYPMLDIILVVDNTEEWHTENLRRNPSHYSSVVSLSPFLLSLIQDHIGANFWFNAYVDMNLDRFHGRKMKYGVINKSFLMKDLQTWSCLYAAGRLHKPIFVMKKNDEIEKAIEQNKVFALYTSLLLLPNKFSEVDLYLTIASLSYVGDPRMLIGENPRKVCF